MQYAYFFLFCLNYKWELNSLHVGDNKNRLGTTCIFSIANVETDYSQKGHINIVLLKTVK